MDSTYHPDHVVSLNTTLEEGLALPAFILSDIRAQEEDVDVVIETTMAKVRLTTSSTPEKRPHEQTVILAPPLPLRPSDSYPGIMLDNRYDS